MKISKLFAGLFAVLGIVIAAGALMITLSSLDASPVLLTPLDEAQEQTEVVMEAIGAGDYDALSALLYGNPDLGVDREPADEVGKLIWEAFVESISYTFDGDCHATDTAVSRNVTIETLDISSVTANLKGRSQELLEDRVRDAEDMTEIYDENHEYREDFVMDVLYDAAVQALKEDAQTITWEVTLNLTYDDGQWWVMADQALINAISGGVTG